ncbi:phosphonate C-P lyase system protein PhnG [Rhizobium rhizoryzae]|uniref:Alpha-D-ribose 1-methylphosphonate 5-triphosphate synthase subunit PhnG n=1 Tax=Rhizobium rhizoryzae TaxID=451876 RepID=A0A7W6LIP7_9HYPH|nr:alpha-D-ribose 1-methylphosphonate 5-triphosphate synthase subunit PhnG [Rhizobium rhizoryzae]
MIETAETHSSGQLDAKRALALLARADHQTLKQVWDGLSAKPQFRKIRGPEVGLVMVKGRIGGGGDPFNLGEAGVCRASIETAAGVVGHSYRLGTDKAAAELGAVLHALWQSDEYRQHIESTLLSPIEQRAEAEARTRSQQTAATKVEFFTMVRGED